MLMFLLQYFLLSSIIALTESILMEKNSYPCLCSNICMAPSIHLRASQRICFVTSALIPWRVWKCRSV